MIAECIETCARTDENLWTYTDVTTGPRGHCGDCPWLKRQMRSNYVVLVTHQDGKVDIVGPFTRKADAVKWAQQHLTTQQFEYCLFRVKEMRNPK